MKENYEMVADEIINSSKNIIESHEIHTVQIDTDGLSEMGKFIVGKAAEYAFSPQVHAKAVLSEGYSEFTAIIANLPFGSDEFKAANSAQDKIAEVASLMGFEI